MTDEKIEIEITQEMIEAGISRWRNFHFGQKEAETVEAIYLAMVLEGDSTY